MAESVQFQITDTETSQVLIMATGEVPDILDAVCRQIDTQLAANGEGAGAMRFQLAVHAIGAGGTRTWCGERVHRPTTPDYAPNPHVP